MAESTKSIEDYKPWIRLRLTDGLTVQRFLQLIRLFQTPEAIFGQSVKNLTDTLKIPNELAENILKGPEEDILNYELEAIAEHDVKLATINDDDYPKNLKQSSAPPPLIFYKGEFQENDCHSLAVVGTRKFSQYGRLACEKICDELARAGITIISGMAYGIDTIAHWSALNHNSRTIAVLGNGLSTCYPKENEGLFESIIENGAVLTEYPMFTKPDRFNFPARNRIIAALSMGVLIAEAPLKSGALITADYALEDNRDIFAIPGDISRKNSEGTNRLIQQGAKLVTSAQDIIVDLKFQLTEHIEQEVEKAKSATLETLPDLEKQIFSYIADEPIQIDALLQILNELEDVPPIDIAKLSSILFNLEMKNLIKQLPGQIYAAA